MPRKANRFPGVEKRGEKWRARAFFDGKEVAKSFTTQEEAIRWKREQQRALERGEWIDPRVASISFKDWSDAWLNGKSNIAPRTRRGYLARLRSHLLPEFGNRKITSITNNQISQWISRSISAGVGLVTIRQCHGVLRQIFNAAILDGRLSRNPALGVPLPRISRGEKRALNTIELLALANECQGYETLIRFAGTTGLRWGEISALQCKDVSPLHRTVFVGKSYSDGLMGERILGSTKTHQSRSVPLPKDLIRELEFLMNSRLPEEHLFVSPDSRALDYNNFMSRVFRPAIRRLGLEGITFHSLRHTAASLLISQGTPITTVSGILGHASTQMTLDVYGHLYEDDAMTYMDRLGERIYVGTDKERPQAITALKKLTV